MRPHIIGSATAGHEKRGQPAEFVAPGSDFRALQEVAFGDDPDERSIRVDHRQAARTVLNHQPERIHKRHFRCRHDHIPRHHIGCDQGESCAPSSLRRLVIGACGNAGLAHDP